MEYYDPTMCSCSPENPMTMGISAVLKVNIDGKLIKEVLEQLLSYVRGGFKMPPEYARRLDAFFPVRDENNCQRTFDIISKL